MILEIPIIIFIADFNFGTSCSIVIPAPDARQYNSNKMDDTHAQAATDAATSAGSPKYSQGQADRKNDLKQVADGVESVGLRPSGIFDDTNVR